MSKPDFLSSDSVESIEYSPLPSLSFFVHILVAGFEDCTAVGHVYRKNM